MWEGIKDGFEKQKQRFEVDLDRFLAEKERINKANKQFLDKMKKEFEGHVTALKPVEEIKEDHRQP